VFFAAFGLAVSSFVLACCMNSFGCVCVFVSGLVCIALDHRFVQSLGNFSPNPVSSVEANEKHAKKLFSALALVSIDDAKKDAALTNTAEDRAAREKMRKCALVE
jgi:hypothetical protein